MSKIANLIENIIEKRPHDARKIFDDIMVENTRAVVSERKDIVAESFFEDIDEDDEDLKKKSK